MHIIRPDTVDQKVPFSITVFLAGTIENGTVEPWAHRVIQEFADEQKLTFFDPRKDHWNPDVEKRAHDPEFRHQVEWELAHLEAADLIFFNFLGGSKSPITLQELGYVIGSRSQSPEYVTTDRMPIVVCPDDFWRKGNVEVLCDRMGVDVFSTLDEGIAELRNAIHRVRNP